MVIPVDCAQPETLTQGRQRNGLGIRNLRLGQDWEAGTLVNVKVKLRKSHRRTPPPQGEASIPYPSIPSHPTRSLRYLRRQGRTCDLGIIHRECVYQGEAGSGTRQSEVLFQVPTLLFCRSQLGLALMASCLVLEWE